MDLERGGREPPEGLAPDKDDIILLCMHWTDGPIFNCSEGYVKPIYTDWLRFTYIESYDKDFDG